MLFSDGRNAVSLAVVKQADARMSKLKDELDKQLRQFRYDYPDVEFTVTRDQTELLDYSISNLINNIITGALLACVIIFFFMRDMTSPMLVILTIPVTLIISILVFYLLHISINIISLSGLGLGIGMMVDNSIIVIDNITARWIRGEQLAGAVTQGTKEVTFASADPEHPAKFYMVSAPAHCSYETRLIKMADANHRPLGSVETCNKRTINQFIHPDVLKTCQLSMGMTELDPGSNWNTMPSHTHERRMEIYTYFELPEGQVVFHMCGEPTQTRHIVMHNEDAVISPSWSIHSGVGTSNYTFIWAMGGENMEFDDMDNIATTDLR